MTDWFFDPRLADCRRVFIRDFDVSAAIGVFPQELGRTQAVRINIDFWVKCASTPSERDLLVDVVVPCTTRTPVMSAAGNHFATSAMPAAKRLLSWFSSSALTPLVAARLARTFRVSRPE